MLATSVYFTKNTEYHVDVDVCVRVMRREDGRRMSDHPAVGARLLGGVRFPTTKPVLSSLTEPTRGDCLVFMGEEGLVMSTVLEKTQTRDAAGMVLTENGEDVATWQRRRA